MSPPCPGQPHTQFCPLGSTQSSGRQGQAWALQGIPGMNFQVLAPKLPKLPKPLSSPPTSLPPKAHWKGRRRWGQRQER